MALPVGTLTRLHATLAALAPIDGVAILDEVAHTVRIDFKASATVPQQAAANAALASFDWSQAGQDAFTITQARAMAQAFLTDSDPRFVVLRGVLLACLAELNLHALKINAILDASDAATTLATFKSAVAAITDYPQRSPLQLKNAVIAQIVSQAAD